MHPDLAKIRFTQDLAGVDAELCSMRGWTVFEKAYPVFDVGFTSPQGKQLRLRMICDNWNEVPPGVELQAWNGTPLTQVPPSSTNIFNGSRHRVTGSPFICMRGTREYHTHESHLKDPWEPLRPLAEYRQGEIVTQIWNGWMKANP